MRGLSNLTSYFKNRCFRRMIDSFWQSYLVFLILSCLNRFSDFDGTDAHFLFYESYWICTLRFVVLFINSKYCFIVRSPSLKLTFCRIWNNESYFCKTKTAVFQDNNLLLTFEVSFFLSIKKSDVHYFHSKPVYGTLLILFLVYFQIFSNTTGIK